jgi:hypothetical protein
MKVSKLNPQQVLHEATRFFGPQGLGLEVKDCGNDCLQFEGAAGHITVEAYEYASGSKVDIIGPEFEHQIQQFMAQI